MTFFLIGLCFVILLNFIIERIHMHIEKDACDPVRFLVSLSTSMFAYMLVFALFTR